MDMIPPAPETIPFSFPGVRGVRCLFSTAAAGDMSRDVNAADPARAAANRARFMRGAGFGHWADVNQVHGDAVVRAAAREGDPPEADGQYTLERGVGLVIRTADCQPILLARADGGAVGALHVGWRANARNFPGAAVAGLCREFGCAPADLVAVRGPSLGPAAAEFVNFVSEWPAKFLPWYDPEARTVDLWALTRHQLRRAGLRRDRIFSVDMCTKTMAGVFFSHRRKESGRQVNAIWLE